VRPHVGAAYCTADSEIGGIRLRVWVIGTLSCCIYITVTLRDVVRATQVACGWMPAYVADAASDHELDEL
jgi:hypothetical protein